MGSVHWTKSVCPHDCPDTCSILVKIEDGQAVATKGDPDHPFTRGALCAKVLQYPKRVHSSDRLLHPMRRVGAKGQGQWEQISWDEALDTISSKLQETVKTYGGESVFSFKGSGNMGLIQSVAHLPFLHALGASRERGSLCSPAANLGWKYTVGSQHGSRPESVAETDLLIAWGSNMATTNMHMLAFYEKARKNGARLIVIDPYRNRTAKQADIHVPIRPGTDAALALAIMHVLVQEDLVDADYIQKMTQGFDQLAEILPAYSPEKVAPIVGYSADGIRELARMYGQARAPFIRIGMGLSRHAKGGMAVRTIAMLPGLVGAFTKKGGGALLFTSDTFDLNKQVLSRPDFLVRPTRFLNKVQLGDVLLHTEEPPVKVLFVTGGNPAASCPDRAAVVQGLSREDLFTVVHEQFMTDSARYADIVLPATTSFESFDVYKSFGHTFLQKADPVIQPVGEARSNHAVFSSLAQRMGLTDPHFLLTEQELAEKLLPAAWDIETRTRFWNGDMIDMDDKQLETSFRTPSGKIEFYSESMARDGYEPVPFYDLEAEEDLEEAERTFHLLTPPAHFTLNSSFGAVSELRDKEQRPILQMHPDDAAECGIDEDGWVIAGNTHGEVMLWVRRTTDTPRGVLAAEGVWWSAYTPDQQSINNLTGSHLTDMGYGSTLHDNRVWVKPAAVAGSTVF